MDQQRLFWEGGEEYFREMFPFMAVWVLSGAGAFLGSLALLVSRSHRWLLWSIALVLNGLLLCWYLHRYKG